ncbi:MULTISPECIES: heavy metal-binding domain-containing protein [unclassified Mucilaginibacter]|uniref:heavy metal-binding domain-containing protein n=1 Tax=unclassified Mucilaginibacter TaxID=2617802 RepID=UPI002AC9B73E|nr:MULTISPECIES: heavy metal-binding domain-containing protein [unclassified Mucilaginibacter]MEB0262947.1 heavy metal-binding domain-containing protein [Mucilaginibacter sp. 10I4]MEB0278204.1 heavy metal-binding domain-containing protein [Mucilaginibacter sp. 10B2]MEB0302488.1 heavy metal-binding domain-containing protein [Mucilaginibacter sp. 5C4]WPX23850.1 heavy metal-binding domain-containing protein [Mucilaginibacter sp. 5C4]
MKKVTLMAIAILFSAATVFAGDTHTGKMAADTTKKVNPAKVQYTCTMHPEVLSDKPGKCSKCGMALVKKTAVKKKPAAKMKM